MCILQLKQDNPSLADAVAAGDVSLFAAVVRSIETTRRIEADERSALYKCVQGYDFLTLVGLGGGGDEIIRSFERDYTLVWVRFYVFSLPTSCLTAFHRRLEANPNDAEAQSEIAEIIRMEAVQENMLSAMEHHPEAFGQVRRTSYFSHQ